MPKILLDAFVTQIISASHEMTPTEHVEILLDEFRTRVRNETIEEVRKFLDRLK